MTDQERFDAAQKAWSEIRTALNQPPEAEMKFEEFDRFHNLLWVATGAVVEKVQSILAASPWGEGYEVTGIYKLMVDTPKLFEVFTAGGAGSHRTIPSS